MEAKDVRTLMEAYASVYEGYGKKKKGDCVSKSEKGDHNCAKKVCHEQYGEGETIFGQHAIPDENGFVSHYDVQFEHGIVENVSVEDMDILTMEAHGEHVEHEGETISEMVPALQEPVKKALDAGAEFMDKNPVGRTIKKVLAPAGPGKNTPTKADQEKKIQQNNSADLFDIVKGYLMSEGLSEKEALEKMLTLTDEERTEMVEQNMITRTGTSTNAAGEKIKWTHNHDKNTGRSTVTDKYGTRDSTPVKRGSGSRPTKGGYIR